MNEHTLVIVDTPEEVKERFEYFISLVGKEQVFQAALQKDYARIQTTTGHTISFMIKSINIRGRRCQHLFNLTQNIDYHSECALPTVRPKFQY